MTAANNAGMWHRGVERGAEALDNAWRRVDLHQSRSCASARLVGLYSNYACSLVLFYFFVLFLLVLFLRCTIRGPDVAPSPVLFLGG